MRAWHWVRKFNRPLPMGALGIALGLFWPAIGKQLGIVSPLFGLLLLTAITPYIATVVIARVLHFRSIGTSWRFVSRFFLSFVLLSGVMVVVAMVMLKWLPRMYQVSDANLVQIGQLLANSGKSDVEFSVRKLDLSGQADSGKKQQAVNATLIEPVITSNIYRALEHGDTLAVIVFSLCIGMALALPSRASDQFQQFCVGISGAASLMMRWFEKIQPSVLLCVMAFFFSQVGGTSLSVTAAFIEVLLKCTILFVLICMALVWYWSRKPLADVVTCFVGPILVTLSSDRSIASIPLATQLLEQKLSINAAESEAVLPLGMTLQNYGIILYYICALAFSAELLQHAYSTRDLFSKMVPASFMATAFSLGGGTIGNLRIAGSFMLLSTDVAIILLTAIDLLAGPCRQICTTCGNLTVAVLLFSSRDRQNVDRANSDVLLSNQVEDQ